jgi:alkane 1-monooxygenase
MRDLKYLFAYTVPITAFISFESIGLGTYVSVMYTFIALPFLDLVTGEKTKNLSTEEVTIKKTNWVFDGMLYLNLPIVFGLLWLVFSKIQTQNYATYELIGLGLSAGVLLATNAINVAHELGHRAPYFERFMAKCLYRPCLYMHFYIEHNFGHHMNVATPKDGATAKYNQTVFSFWVTSVTKQYIDAWNCQMKLLKTQNRPFLSVKNDMLWYHLIQPTYIFGVFYFFSFDAMLFAFVIALVIALAIRAIRFREHTL